MTIDDLKCSQKYVEISTMLLCDDVVVLQLAKAAGVARTALEGPRRSTSVTFGITRQASLETGSFHSNTQDDVIGIINAKEDCFVATDGILAVFKNFDIKKENG